jgi:hypothetical protein
MKFLLTKFTYEDKEFKVNIEFEAIKEFNSPELLKIKEDFKIANNLNGHPLFAMIKQIDKAFEYEKV